VPRQARIMLRCWASHLVCIPGASTLPVRGCVRVEADQVGVSGMSRWMWMGWAPNLVRMMRGRKLTSGCSAVNCRQAGHPGLHDAVMCTV
jgi:hypothetical protein